jgi:hypothetical protein
VKPLAATSAQSTASRPGGDTRNISKSAAVVIAPEYPETLRQSTTFRDTFGT